MLSGRAKPGVARITMASSKQRTENNETAYIAAARVCRVSQACESCNVDQLHEAANSCTSHLAAQHALAFVGFKLPMSRASQVVMLSTSSSYYSHLIMTVRSIIAFALKRLRDFDGNMALAYV